MLAKAIGLPAANVEIGNAQGIDYLLVERYDRIRTQSTDTNILSLGRLHPEDFCQALNIAGKKYEHEGGPSIKQCFELIRKTSSAPLIDIPTLLDDNATPFL